MFAAASLENDLAINIIIQPDFDTLLPSAGSLEPAVANALVELCFLFGLRRKSSKASQTYQGDEIFSKRPASEETRSSPD